MPISSTSSSARKAFGLRGSGKCPNEYTMHSGTMSTVSSTIGSEMPSSPMM